MCQNLPPARLEAVRRLFSESKEESVLVRPGGKEKDMEPSVNASSREGNSLVGMGMRNLESRRLELESGAGGDHDVPYCFVLPPSMPQVLVWMRLLASRERGELPS